jgi:hypothetical protein
LLAVFGSSLLVTVLTMDISRTMMMMFFGIVTIASGLLVLVSVPQIREREEFYKDDVEHQLSLRTSSRRRLIF